MDVNASSSLLGLGRVHSKVPAVLAGQAGTGVRDSTAFGVQAADNRRNTGLTRARKAAHGPLTVDRMASEWYPHPPPNLAMDLPAAATRYMGR